MSKFFQILTGVMLMGSSGIYADEASSPDSQLQNKSIIIDIFADALYWTTSETIDWVVRLIQAPTSGDALYDTLSFNWEPGFRAGIGYNMEYDNWDTRLYYTYFRAETSAHINAGPGLLVPAFLGNRAASASLFTFNYKTGKVDWELNYDMLDWDLGRSYFVASALTIRPYIGLKGGWIKQRIHSKWRNPNLFIIEGLLISTENLKNDFSGIGPKGGINTKWILGKPKKCFFSFLGELSTAYMWANWRISDHFKTNRGEKAKVTAGDSRKFGSFMIQAFMGLGFDLNLRSDESHLALKVGYEIQDWFNQFQIFDNGTGGHNNDLVLQGLTANACFDF